MPVRFRDLRFAAKGEACLAPRVSRIHSLPYVLFHKKLEVRLKLLLHFASSAIFAERADQPMEDSSKRIHIRPHSADARSRPRPASSFLFLFRAAFCRGASANRTSPAGYFRRRPNWS